MKFKYDNKKYSLENMYDKVDLAYANFYCIGDSGFRSFCIEEYGSEYSKVYNPRNWEKKIHNVETKRIALCFNDAVEYEYKKLLSELSEEQREYMDDLVKWKEHTAAVAGYNGYV